MERHPVPGVGAVIIEDDSILLILRGSGAWKDYWAVPGGKIRFGETMQEAVVREVREETGLDVDVGDVAWVGDIIDDQSPPRFHYSIVDFFAVRVGGELAAGDDAAEVVWVAFDDLEDHALTPTMRDLLAQLAATGVISRRGGTSGRG